jgi:hypothetical protein
MLIYIYYTMGGIFSMFSKPNSNTGPVYNPNGSVDYYRGIRGGPDDGDSYIGGAKNKTKKNNMRKPKSFRRKK